MLPISKTKRSKDSKQRRDVSRHFNNKERQQRAKRRKLNRDAHRLQGALGALGELQEVQFEALDWAEPRVSVVHLEQQPEAPRQPVGQAVGSRGEVEFHAVGGSLE
jgi:hypothetical protein